MVARAKSSIGRFSEQLLQMLQGATPASRTIEAIKISCTTMVESGYRFVPLGKCLLLVNSRLPLKVH